MNISGCRAHREGAAIFYCNQDKIDDQLHNIDVVWVNVISEYDFLNLDLTQKPEAARFEEESYNTVGICGLKSVLDLILAIGITKIEYRTLNLTDRLKAKKYTIISLHENQSERLGSRISNYSPQTQLKLLTVAEQFI